MQHQYVSVCGCRVHTFACVSTVGEERGRQKGVLTMTQSCDNDLWDFGFPEDHSPNLALVIFA